MSRFALTTKIVFLAVAFALVGCKPADLPAPDALPAGDLVTWMVLKDDIFPPAVTDAMARRDELERIKDEYSPADARAARIARRDQLERIKDDSFAPAVTDWMARRDELERIKDEYSPEAARAIRIARRDQLELIKDDVWP